MVTKLARSMKRHDHWFAEWWSGLVLIVASLSGFLGQNKTLVLQPIVYGYSRLLHHDLWQLFFLMVGIFQLVSLRQESLSARWCSALLAFILYAWGTLNIFLYSQHWHFSLIAWGAFSFINFYALSRITTGMERRIEYL